MNYIMILHTLCSIVNLSFILSIIYSGGTAGIMVQLEEALGQRFLHLYCRHHVYERYKFKKFGFESKNTI